MPIVDIFVWSAIAFITILLGFWGYGFRHRISRARMSRARFDSF